MSEYYEIPYSPGTNSRPRTNEMNKIIAQRVPFGGQVRRRWRLLFMLVCFNALLCGSIMIEKGHLDEAVRT